jgi:hypothetical protein
MYLTAFIHRDDLFQIGERWFCGRTEGGDALQLSELLISNGFVAGESVRSLAHLLFGLLGKSAIQERRLRSKGEFRDALCRGPNHDDARVTALLSRYQQNPDYFYREVPVNGVLCLDAAGGVCGMYRLKRPRRIAEKVNRRLARWIFDIVQTRAQSMAATRARERGIPLEYLLTPPSEMAHEFISAEEEVARDFREGTIRFDRDALTIHDVAGIKVIGTAEQLSHLEARLQAHPVIRVLDRSVFEGRYQATALTLEVVWDAEAVCRAYRDSQAWERFRGRGISEAKLQAGLEPLLLGAAPTLIVEVMLTTFPDLVESELGRGLHEARIIEQRENRVYTGYLPMNIEFLVEYLFAVGFSPQTEMEEVPIKLWGRYLPDTLTAHIRRLYGLPDPDLLN